MATWGDFQKLDIRIGTVVDVQDFPAAKKPAYRLAIDFGPLGIKRSSAQLTALYRPEDLLGAQVVCVVNFPPKAIAGFVSEVLVLGALSAAGVILLRPERPAAPGDRIA